MIHKKILITIVALSSLLLTGCFGSNGSEKQTLSFDGFSLQIDQAYESVPGGLVENKQILNKLLKSFKLTNNDGFDQNIVITSSEIAQHIDYDQFNTANTDKLRTDIVGYKPSTKEVVTFECGDEIVQGVLVSFSVDDSFYEATSTYYLYQYQYVYNQKGYIISYATSQNDTAQMKSFITIVDSLGCTKSV